MRTLARWIARHRKLSSIIAFVFWTGMVCINICIDGPMWLFIILAAFGMIVTNVVINTAPVECIKQEIKAFSDHCDPNPMIEVISDLLNYQHAEYIESALEQSYCNALYEAGQYQAALDRLNEINIDKSPATFPGTKVLYYIGLYESCTALGHHEQAEIWYQKAMTIYRDLKEDRSKKQLDSSVAMVMGDYELRHGNPDEAMALHEKATENTMLERVTRRYLLARILLMQGKTDEARKALEYVVSNGNRLHTVTLAKELLETI